jgi:hypothetical protein
MILIMISAADVIYDGVNPPSPPCLRWSGQADQCICAAATKTAPAVLQTGEMRVGVRDLP